MIVFCCFLPASNKARDDDVMAIICRSHFTSLKMASPNQHENAAKCRNSYDLK